MTWHRRHPDWRLLESLNRTWSPPGQRCVADAVMTEWDATPDVPLVLDCPADKEEVARWVVGVLGWRARWGPPSGDGARTCVLYPPQPAPPDWSFIVPFAIICVLAVLTGVGVALAL